MKTLYIQILLILFFSIVSSVHNQALASDNTSSLGIKKVSYTGYLGDDTIVDIVGTQLGTCSNIYVNGEQIFISGKSDTKISFPYSSVGKPQGHGELQCDSKNIAFFYKFPYIHSAIPQDIENFKRKVQIKGENFSQSASVTINGGSFNITAQTSRQIMGTISKDTTKTSLFVEQNGLKSNVIALKIAIPEIQSIQAPDGFYPGKKIHIIGNNIHHTANTILMANEKEYDYHIDSQNGNMIVTLGKDPGIYDFTVEHNGIISNSVEITVLGVQPIIKRAYKSKYSPSEDSGIQIDAFALDMVDVKGDISGISVWHNGKSYSINYIKKDQIFVDHIQLSTGTNYFYVESHGSFSEVYTLENGSDNYFPSITSVKVSGFTKDKTKRILKVATTYYDPKKDSLYLNDSKLHNFECLGNVCTILVNPNTLYGRFDVEREGVFALGSKEFDVRSKNIAYFEGIKILGTQRSSKVEIFGNNLLTGNFNDGNIFSHNNKGNPHFTLNQQSITGKLLRDLTFTESYSVGFEQYGESINNSFKLEDFKESNTLYFPAKLLSIGVNNEIFSGETTKVYGFGFSSEDTVSIGGNTLSFNKVTGQSNKIGYITIPDYFPLGTFELKVSNISGKDSKPININILPPRSEVAVNITTKPITHSIPFSKDEVPSSATIQKISIGKLYSDVIIKKVTFTLQGAHKNILSKMGTFSLHSNNREVGYAKINNDGKIVFTTPFELRHNNSPQTLELKKRSPFIFSGKFAINFNTEEFEFESKKTQLSLSAKFTNAAPYIFSVISEQKIHCVEGESQSGESYCDTQSSNNNDTIANNETLIENTYTSTETLVENTFVDNNVVIEYSLRQQKEDATMLLNNFTKGGIYIEKINSLLQKVSSTKLNTVQQKLNSIDMSTLSEKPMIEALVNFLKASVNYEISLR